MNNRYYLGLTFSVTSNLRAYALGVGQGVKILDILNFFWYDLHLIFSFMESFVIEQKVLIRVDFLSVTSDYWVQSPTVGLGIKI